MKRLLLIMSAFLGLLLFSPESSGQTTITIGTGTSTQRYPLGNYFGYERSAALYTSAEMTTGGTISKINWYATVARSTTIPIKIYLKETSSSTLTASTWATMISGATLVFDANNTSITANAWNEFPLTTSFIYSGSSNIMVLVEANYGGGGTGGSSGTGVRYSSVTSCHQTWAADTSPPTGSGTVGSSRPNIQFVITNSACSGTPNPGNTISSANPVCSGVNFTLSLQNATPGTGVTYQWQSSDDMAFTSPTNLGTATTQVTSQTVSTYYRCQVTCSGNTGTSNPLQVTLNAPTNCYCSSVPTSNDGSGITNVLLGSTNFPTGDVTYYFHNSPVVDLAQGLLANCDITFATGYTYDTHIWIDFNDDGTFSNTTEKVYTGVSLATNPTTLNADFTVPAGATLGQHRMRIGTADSGQATPDPCYSGGYGVTLDFNVNIVAPPSCLAPTALSATNITNNSANIGWTAGGSETEWEYVYGVSPVAAPSGSGTATSNNPTSLSGLSGNTTYQFYVRANCGGGDFSPWAGPYTFTTACDAFTNFVENFDGVTAPALPSCWSKYISPSFSFQTVTTITTLPNSSPNVVSIYSSGATASTDAPMLITPALTNLGSGTHQLKFFAKGASSNLSVIVGTMSDPTNAATFTAFQTVTGLNTSSYTECLVSFASYSGSNTYIAFKHPLTATYSYIYIDDVVWEPLPACPKPTSLTATGITGTSANIGWTPGGTETAWEYSYGVSPHSAPDGAGTATMNNPTALSGLTGATTYQFYVRANCGSEFSPWAGPSTFATLPANDECADAITVTVNADNTCTSVTPGTTLGATQSMVGCVGTADDDVWFKFVATYPSHQFELLNRVAVSGTSTDMVHQVFSGTCGNLTSLSCSDPESSTVNGLTIGQTYYVRVYNYYETSRNTFNLCIKLPPCSTPTGLTATNLTPSGATLNWTENGGANTWDLYIVAAGSPVPDGTSTPTVDDTGTKPYVWLGGMPSTPYDWYVRSDCGASGGSGQSSWSAVGTFTTASADAVDWCNLQYPGSETITQGTTVNVFAQAYEPGVTPGAGAGAGITAWIGYSNTDTNPNTWTNWFAATYNTDVGNNDEYMYALGSGLPAGTYYYASRFKLNTGPYTYGGFNAGGGGFWDGTNNVSGVLTVQSPVGGVCTNPIIINTLPYTTTDNTSNYFDDYSGSPGATGCGTTSSYLNGDDVVYKYTPTADGCINITMTPTDTWSGIFVYEDCADIGFACIAGVANAGSDPRIISNLAVSANQPYFIVISTWPDPQSVGYDLEVEYCPPANDDCASATPVPDSQQGDPVNGSTTGGSDSGASTVGCPDSTPGSSDVWYLLEDVDDEGGNRVITIQIDPNAGENYAIYLYDAMDCGTLGDPVACANSGGNGVNETLNYTVTVQFNSDNGSGERSIRDFWVRIKQIGSNVGSFVMSLTGTALPLQLLDIKATAMPKYNLIEWATASEKNTSHMTVERNNGSSLNWEVIGIVDAAGFSDDIRNYSFEDNRPYQKSYYRVRSLDNDGLEQISRKVYVDRITVGGKPGLVNAYPMPVSKSLFVDLNMDSDQTVTIHLMTITGQSVMQIKKELKAGVQTVELDLSELPSGVYLARISSPELSETVRIIKE